MRTARDFRRPDAKEDMMLVHFVVCVCAAFGGLGFLAGIVFWLVELFNEILK